MPAYVAAKLATWTGGSWTRMPESALTGFTQDTRKLAAGQVFVALKTDKRDGHEFLDEAKARGATAALVAQANPQLDLPQLVIADPLGAFQTIAREHRREFSGTVIGISGSVGKTSTKDLLALLLGGAPAVLATEGNLNNFLGVPLTLTRLDPAQHRRAVIEAGINLPGEMATLATMIEPDHSLITLVAPAHLERLGSLEGVAREKATLPAANREGGLAVFPVSCWSYEVFRSLSHSVVLVPETEDMTRVTARTIRFNVFHRPDRTELTLAGTRRFHSRRISSGMAQNATLALALASELGVGDQDLQTRLAQWQPSRWRGELRQHGGSTVYCDFYNANPAAMGDAIDAFNSAMGASRPRFFVLGSMEELGEEADKYHQLLGRTIHLRPGDLLFALGSHAVALREGLLENGNNPAQVEVIADLALVRARLADFTGAVFLKGSRRYQLETILDPRLPAVGH